MKKLIALLTLLVSISLPSAAQNYTEVVYLKNGSVIRGVIIEEVPNTSLKIQTYDGSVFFYNIGEVEKITKEVYSKRNKPMKQPKAYRQPESYAPGKSGRQACAPGVDSSGRSLLRGYKGFAEAGYIFDLTSVNAERIDLSTTHGYQFNNYLFVGGGASFNYFTGTDRYSIPIFSSFRVNFTNKKITPFADIKLGYTIGDYEGAYVAGGFGVRFALAHRKAFHVKLEYALQDYSYMNHGHDNTESVNGVGLKLGFEF